MSDGNTSLQKRQKLNPVIRVPVAEHPVAPVGHVEEGVCHTNVDDTEWSKQADDPEFEAWFSGLFSKPIIQVDASADLLQKTSVDVDTCAALLKGICIDTNTCVERVAGRTSAFSPWVGKK